MNLTLLSLLLVTSALAHGNCWTLLEKGSARNVVKINTSNAGKRAEFQRLFGDVAIEFTSQDLKEVDATPMIVVTQKASQFGPDENVLIEDTSLYVEGSDVGVNVRWLIDNLSSLNGRKAVWTVYLARRIADEVQIFKGEINGRITRASGNGFGFDSVFIPDGETKTLGEEKPDRVNARATAVRNFLLGNIHQTRPVILDWQGKWQHE